jgi:hypothetical protein
LKSHHERTGLAPDKRLRVLVRRRSLIRVRHEKESSADSLRYGGIQLFIQNEQRLPVGRGDGEQRMTERIVQLDVVAAAITNEQVVLIF